MLNYSKCYIWTAVKSSCMDNCQSYPMLRWNCVHTSCGFLELFTFQIRFCFFIFLQSFYVLYCTNFILNKINKYINTYVSKENTNIGSVLCWHVVLMKTVSTKFFFLCHLYHVTWSFPYHMPRCLPLQFFNSLIHRQVQLQNSTVQEARQLLWECRTYLLMLCFKQSLSAFNACLFWCVTSVQSFWTAEQCKNIIRHYW